MKLNPARLLVCLLLAFTTLISCQKEVSEVIPNGQSGGGTGGNPGNSGEGPGTNNIAGEYTFVGLDASTTSSVIMTSGSDQTKNITTTDYTTEDNHGDVRITASEMASTDLGYSIDDMMNVKSYTNGVLQDDLDLPFVLTVPTSSATSTYTKIGVDSIETVNFQAPSTSPSTQSPGSPIRFKCYWKGDTLCMKTATAITQTMTTGGVPVTQKSEIKATYRLKKK